MTLWVSGSGGCEHPAPREQTFANVADSNQDHHTVRLLGGGNVAGSRVHTSQNWQVAAGIGYAADTDGLRGCPTGLIWKGIAYGAARAWRGCEPYPQPEASHGTAAKVVLSVTS